jgi:3-deoxy-7-phosphoheptulonate synthase
MLKHLSHLPVIVDPSHGTGLRWMVPVMAKAAVAAGADGLIMEVHYKPETALCDGAQSLDPDEFAVLMNDIRKVAKAVGREIS